ncbi:hypothetical protein AWJ20_4995 [Sugiyamaella lignohabitans]|uniref:Carboxymuconolactone decarboxylase-like domain-containing protein n=1 Tax=Sugiyamaella lignohabitans TaxID=796027 RepID=A0A167EG43_9ASCO|nr:uncharacterized protein AWJ20_4995 [Sugiyamaella lignohabitans]ANB14039.1 hypothetical protein AWJ20_4995 [Sugiyamaella lignohabitans]
MRVEYYEERDDDSQELKKAVEIIKKRRGPTGLLELDRGLLHSPQMAVGWSQFLGSVRADSKLSRDIKELAISRVAFLNKAKYEWEHHSVIAAEAGVSAKGLTTIQQPDAISKGLSHDESVYGLTLKQQASVLYTDEMTKNVQVKDETFALLKQLFSEEEIVELTITVGAYNCVSRFLVALDINEQNERSRNWSS